MSLPTAITTIRSLGRAYCPPHGAEEHREHVKPAGGNIHVATASPGRAEEAQAPWPG